MTTDTDKYKDEQQGVFKTEAHKIAFNTLCAKTENASLLYIGTKKEAEAEFEDTIRKIENGVNDND